MSLHARPSPEALERLHIQRRNSTISSILAAFLFTILLSLVLGFFLLKPMVQEPPVFVIYEPPYIDRPEIPERKPMPSLERNPSSPSHAMARVVTTMSASPVSVPVPDMPDAEPSPYFGDGHDFGHGWQQNHGQGAAGGGGGFGSSNRSSGGLEGWLYDLKQTRDGKPRAYAPGNMADFAEPAVRLQREKFSPTAWADHFRAPKPLYLTHLAIPQMSAGKAPELFGAEGSIQPSGWIAHYRGTVIVPRTGTYRFSGVGDDYLVVMLDGKPRLYGSLPDLNAAVRGRWDGSRAPGDFRVPYKNRPIVYGDWVSLRAGQEVEMDIAIGERPGGELWFLLHIEERGVKYRKAADGRPVLPLFTTAPFSEEESNGLRKDFGSYEIDFDNVPVFRVK